MNATTTINRAFAAVVEQHEETKVATDETMKHYVGLLVRLADDKPRKADAVDLATMATELGFSKRDVESDLDSVKSLLAHRKRIVDGENAWKEVCRLRAEIMAAERKHEGDVRALEQEKQRYESLQNCRSAAPARMLEIQRDSPHLFRSDDPPTLLCEKPD